MFAVGVRSESIKICYINLVIQKSNLGAIPVSRKQRHGKRSPAQKIIPTGKQMNKHRANCELGGLVCHMLIVVHLLKKLPPLNGD